MNQSYVSTLLISGGATYFFTETFGVGLDAAFGFNSDKEERTCIESFYLDPNNDLLAGAPPCGPRGFIDEVTNPTDEGFPRYGPAYVPIREINQVFSINAIWSPIYGKQLLLMRATSYFDLFIEGGLGFVVSTFYPEQPILKNTNEARAPYTPTDVEGLSAEEIAQIKAENNKIGATADQVFAYGVDGRPDPISGQHVALNLGIGQKFHFGGRFHLKVAIRSMTLLGTEQGIESLFAIYGGAGLRF